MGQFGVSCDYCAACRRHKNPGFRLMSEAYEAEAICIPSNCADSVGAFLLKQKNLEQYRAVFQTTKGQCFNFMFNVMRAIAGAEPQMTRGQGHRSLRPGRPNPGALTSGRKLRRTATACTACYCRSRSHSSEALCL